MNVLTITNMGASRANPAQGKFVRRQVEALKKQAQKGENLYYYEMPKSALEANSSLKKYAIFFLVFVKQFVLSKTKIDILHVHFYFPTILLAALYRTIRNRKAKIVVTFHGSDIYHYQKPNFIYRYFSKSIDHAIFVSPSLKQRFFKQDVNASVMSAGILPIFQPEPEKHKSYDFIFVGTLDENKGALRLKALCDELKHKFKFLIVGAGPLQNVFENSSHPNIQYHTYMEAQELVHCYQSARWSLSLSQNESFGLVMAEAMACGTPVIATCTDGAKAQITDSVNGFILTQTDALSLPLQQTIQDIDDAAYCRLSSNAIASAKRQYIDEIATNIANIYRHLYRTPEDKQ